jgi:hypothetical protein
MDKEFGPQVKKYVNLVPAYISECPFESALSIATFLLPKIYQWKIKIPAVVAALLATVGETKRSVGHVVIVFPILEGRLVYMFNQ